MDYLRQKKELLSYRNLFNLTIKFRLIKICQVYEHQYYSRNYELMLYGWKKAKDDRDGRILIQIKKMKNETRVWFLSISKCVSLNSKTPAKWPNERLTDRVQLTNDHRRLVWILTLTDKILA